VRQLHVKRVDAACMKVKGKHEVDMHDVHVEGEHEDNTCGCMWVKHGKIVTESLPFSARCLVQGTIISCFLRCIMSLLRT
jgi:hypothetical protein